VVLLGWCGVGGPGPSVALSGAVGKPENEEEPLGCGCPRALLKVKASVRPSRYAAESILFIFLDRTPPLRGGIDDSCISDLPICALKRVFSTRSPENPWLHLVEFQVECLNVVTFQNLKSVRQMAGLLVFAYPTEASKSRRWYLKCANILDLLIQCSSNELVDAVRFMWYADVLSRELRHNFTLNACIV
jgi:hypothetical protein